LTCFYASCKNSGGTEKEQNLLPHLFLLRYGKHTGELENQSNKLFEKIIFMLRKKALPVWEGQGENSGN
jgi:hypothetical protein